MTDFDIIREALFLVTRETHNSALAALDHLRAILAERDAEIERLRGVALDLSLVPEGWIVNYLDYDPGYNPNKPWTLWMMRNKDDGLFINIDGEGPTPAAALNAAIERTK